MDRRDAENDEYVFISYSHKDSDIVYADLNRLYDDGLRFWYDTEMKAGDDWSDVAKDKLRNKKCLGVVFYMSPNFFRSFAIEKEIKMYKEIKEERQDFIICPISIGGLSVNEMIRNLYIELSGLSGKELGDTFPQERLAQALSVFKDETLYIPRSDDPSDLKHITEVVKDLNDHPLFSNDERILDLLINKNILNKTNREITIELGQYPKHKGNVDYPTVRNGDHTEQSGIRYRIANGTSFLFERISWKLVEMDGFHGTFVSDQCIDVMSGGSEIDEWLISQFAETAFSEEERTHLIGDVTLLKAEWLIKYKKHIGETGYTEYANSKRGASIQYAWLYEFTDADIKKRNCSNMKGALIEGVPTRNLGGVRPMIHVDFRSLLNKDG